MGPEKTEVFFQGNLADFGYFNYGAGKPTKFKKSQTTRESFLWEITAREPPSILPPVR
jgi:hypothetical protein